MATKFSAKLLKQLEFQLLKEIGNLQKQIKELKKSDPFSDPDHALDNAAIDTDVREQVGHDTIEAEVKDLEKRLVDIDYALKKMKKGTYGICERCKKSIPLARLKILPEARYCVECEKILRK